MPDCRVCHQPKPLFDFPDEAAGEALTCIACARAESERSKVAQAGAARAQQERRAVPQVAPATNGLGARLQKAQARVRVLEPHPAAPTSSAKPTKHSLSPAPAPSVPVRGDAPAARTAPSPPPAPRPGAAKELSPAEAVANELVQAVESRIEAMRAQIEEEVRARVEAEFAAKRGPLTVGFRVIAFDDQDRPLSYARLRASLDAVESLLRKRSLPALATSWNAWQNGAWLIAAPEAAETIAQAIETADIPGVEVFTGYPEDFFLSAVPL